MEGNNVKRPDNLPDFQKPPLNEVVLGVQFNAIRGYQQIRAGEVWNLFRADFPTVEELPAIAPAFETFGLPQQPQFNFGIVTGVTHNRFWFLSPDREELIQFQNDRLLHNWRKVGDQTNEYPRFERMIERFSSELQKLEGYFSSLSHDRMTINQCEISYINHMYTDDPTLPPRPDMWLSFLNFAGRNPDDFSAGFREIIRDSAGKPQGRLMCEAVSAANPRGQRMIALTLTARGAPHGSDVQSALEFLKRGREMIVKLFADVTTDSAHKMWERVQ